MKIIFSLIFFCLSSPLLAQWSTSRSWITDHLDSGGKLEDITGLVLPYDWFSAADWDDIKVQATLPTSFDWRSYRKMQPIRNQASCGSCWMFSVTAVMESLHRLLYPIYYPVVDLSEQQGVSCSGHGSCGGGYFSAFSYLRDNGLAPEADFPYEARNLRCKSGLESLTKLTSWKYVGGSERKPTTEQVKQAIYDHGPVSVDVNGSFGSYGSGVYTGCGRTGTNHMVTLEGWVDDPQYDRYGGGYWIMRNSWGSGWGENGYMRIVYKSSGGSNCNGIAQIAAYAVMDNIENIRDYLGIK